MSLIDLLPELRDMIFIFAGSLARSKLAQVCKKWTAISIAISQRESSAPLMYRWIPFMRVCNNYNGVDAIDDSDSSSETWEEDIEIVTDDYIDKCVSRAKRKQAYDAEPFDDIYERVLFCVNYIDAHLVGMMQLTLYESERDIIGNLLAGKNPRYLPGDEHLSHALL